MSNARDKAQRHSVSIQATPEQIWDAITKPELTTKYFYGSAIESSFAPGSPYEAWSPDRSQRFVDGEVLEASPPSLLRHTWRTLWDEESAAEPHSRVSWLIDTEDEHTTNLTLVHDELEAAPHTAASVASGWDYILGRLKAMLETGDPDSVMSEQTSDTEGDASGLHQAIEGNDAA